jgi:hypothetical protein
MGLLDKVDIIPGYRSDHSIVLMEIKLDKFERVKGFWKFNNSLLKDESYINIVKTTIQKVKEEYAALPYNPACIHTIENSELSLLIDDQLFFLTTFVKYKRHYNSLLF